MSDEQPADATAADEQPADAPATATAADEQSGSPTASDIGLERVRARRALVRSLVPSIGDSWRWYDVPYRLCSWLLRGWPRRLLSWRARRLANRWLNFFIAFNEFERAKVETVDDPVHNLGASR